ncbi:beta-ketoacyl synthase N-terminal-like domain-containing protein [Anaeromyxobacter dehalogenans]|uniref:Beta-ketoacyl synthase n=1 Tax=Anaeromyxobacter dehalogenans (strain 2CP-C) TaxID=290397 RepID=Q2IGF2_ANADE|nr:beta-ketoacyl synthase N-terminal-like domain-containing protein [Anaeromyxobacter dehalogenans]ABC83663.1 Beta-ketoacyl synthase [Anaeromyxobacter dehalogenans 2CP-C]
MSQGARIAVVGMGCRLAGAAGLDALWTRLAARRPAPFARVPAARFDPVAFGPEAGALLGGRAPRAALLDDVPLDWRALRVPPLQVERLHLAEKLALQTMAEALADAGMKPGAAPVERGQIRIAATTLGPDPRTDPMRRIRRNRLAIPIGDALAREAPDRRELALAILDRVVDLACPAIEPDSLFTSASIVAGRAANLFDFRGGHAAVDVGSASSLAALYESVEALRRGECDVAVVCAVSPLVTPSVLLSLAHRGELADDVPRPFDPAAAGTLPGEGAAALVLRREDDAAGARVYALVERLGGAAEPGARDPGALARCVERAACAAVEGIGAAEVDAVVSRAAGLASDAGEAAGLAAAYRARKAPVPTRSCVPTTGFLQGATGMVALVEAALALHRGAWPAAEVAGAPRRIGVSDGGPEPVAYHAVLAAPGAPRPAAAPPRPRRRRDEQGYAIVGVGLVVPGANDVDAYWRNVLDHADPVLDLPRSRFDVDALVGANAELAHAFRTRLAATVSPPPFRPERYGIDPEEAAALDGAVPISLLAAEQALADAGWEAARARGLRGQAVFGQLSLRAREAAVETRVAFGNTLALAEDAMREAGLDEACIAGVVARARAVFDARGEARWPQALAATSGYALTARVAAAFGLGGVPLTVDAACASSLAAVAAGCEALARGEVDVALAGGVAYNLVPEYYVALGLLGALSPRGGLPFHVDAEGFVPAEGAGAVALKRLADARADGDRVYAVVRGHGISSDGRGLSIYSPSTSGQQLALRRALAHARVRPETVDLLESHGPATRLGDRTEVATYAAVYGGLPRATPLVLSASKSQVGHTTSAAGLIALVRASLALHRRVLPPSNATRDLDAELHLEAIPAELATEARPWPATAGHPRRAAVSTFGMAGVNHHVILEEAAAPAAATGPAVIPPGDGLAADRLVPAAVTAALPARAARWSLAGRRALVVGPAGGPAGPVAAALRVRGAEALAATPDAVEAAVTSHGAPELLVDLTAFGEPARLDLMAEGGAIAGAARAAAEASYALVRRIYDALLASTPERPGAYVAVTSMGGTLGLGAPAGDPSGAFQHGLALALKQEVPGALVKALDFPPAVDAAALAGALVAELEDGNERVQVGFAGGRRTVVALRQAPLEAGAPARRDLGAGDVLLFSGGGRGVVFECACAIARLGAKVVVTGRTPLPDPALPHLAMDDRAFAEFRRREIVRRRGEPGLTPVRFAREMDALARDRELHRNLERARREGLPLAYAVCDVTDPASVRAVVADVRARHGAITVLGHGAMVERSASVPGKTAADVARVLDSKVAGLLHLLDATRDEPLRAVVAFGSGVARFGNRGQTDYAGANALMAALLPAWMARRGRPVHCVTIDWPAWREIGWAAGNPDIAAGLDAMGVTSISPEEGRYWFVSELRSGDAPETLLVSERMLHAWPFLGASADGARPVALLDDGGVPLVRSASPLVDAAEPRPGGGLVARTRLRADAPFLAQHRVDGRPILPGAFALELLAEAAALARPGERVAEVTGFRIEAPVALARAALDVRAVVEPGEGGVLGVRLVSSLPVAVPGGSERVHARAAVRLETGTPEARRHALPESDGLVRARSFYRLSRDPVELGPLFCRVRWLELLGGAARATVEPADLRAAVPGVRAPAFRVDPLLLDAAFQVAGSLEGYGEGWVCVPIAVERLRAGRALRAGERARVEARRTAEDAPRVFYDLVVAGEDGEELLEVTGLELRRIAAVEVAA